MPKTRANGKLTRWPRARAVLVLLLTALACGLGLVPRPSLGQNAYRAPGVERPSWQPRRRTGVVMLRAAHEGTQVELSLLSGTALQPSSVAVGSASAVAAAAPDAGSSDAKRPLHELRRVGALPRGLGLRDLGRWPAEPKAPAVWDEARFVSALLALCPVTRQRESVAQRAQEVLRKAQEFGIDASLLAALVYQQSGCDAARRTAWGAGLTMLNEGLFPRSLKGSRVYQYGQRQDGHWAATTLPLPRYRFAPDRFDQASENLYFAAAQLRVFQQQCPDIDLPFHSRPHRHYVSHFIWGDSVSDAGAEDRVLTARRRFLAHYHGAQAPPALVSFRQLALQSPLDGAPRIANHGLGEMRDHGRRPHLGVDFISSFGEPVRAIADGVIRYAGTDTSDGRLLNVEPAHAARVPRHDMGPRGLFVRIDHAGGVHSIYAHLAQYTVRAGQPVLRGQLLGYVGRTGIHDSDPHLHFGLFENEQVVDPVLALRGLLFGPDDLLRPASVAVQAERIQATQATQKPAAPAGKPP